MNASKLNDWLGIAANIGVIVGLVFVGYELRQTDIELEREYRQYQSDVLTSSREN